jgi:predicted NBD/HSP70 family sugar kinase
MRSLTAAWQGLTVPVPVLEIGGSHVTAALVDLPAAEVLPGSIRHELSASGTVSDILEAIIACALAVPAPEGATWGVAIPGPFDYQRGVGLFTGVGKFDSLYGVDMGAALAAGLPGHPGPIRFLNDAHAFARGESLFGAAVGHDRCVGITLGTGVGSAFLADGTVCDHGPAVPPEGRVDLLRIDGQPLEDVVSSRAIRRAYQQQTGTRPPDVAWIAQRVSLGDMTAADVLRTAFERLGEALTPWLASFGATMLVVGGSMTGSWNLIKPALETGIFGRTDEPTGSLAIAISVAARGDDAALLGAAAYACAPGTLIHSERVKRPATVPWETRSGRGEA